MYLRVAETAAQSTHDPVIEGWELRSLTARSGVRVSLHSGTEVADAAGDQSLFHVSQDSAGPAGAQQPCYAYVVWLYGEGGEARLRATQFDGHARIWPAIRDIPGVVRLLAGAAADDTGIALVLTTHARAIDDAVRAIKSAPLLPDQDPALLTAPDRDGIYAVSPLRPHSAASAVASGAERLAMARSGMTCLPHFPSYPGVSGRWAV